jgi:cell division protein FtsI (penicillin-binding protein 3)
MATVPSFDPNHFRTATPAQWRNRAVTDLYEPGSTLKAVLAATALEKGVVRPEEPIDCEGGRFRVANRTIRDHHPYDVLHFADVIAFSSNIGCAKVGARLGRDVLGAALRSFGFARPTGIDLPGEASGLMRPEASWRQIDVATASFGQGIAVTPIQLVRAFAAIANGGELMRPHVVRRVIAADGRILQDSTPVVEHRVLSPETARLVTQLLVRVVEEGTGTSARVEGFPVAGKTGTSQKVDPVTGRYHVSERVASFAGFVPADDPALAILVVVDTPTRGSRYGGVVAAPAFRRIAEQGLALLGVLPKGEGLRARREARQPGLLKAAYSTNGPAPALASAPEDVAGRTPSFLGLSMRDALIRAQREGLRVRVEGSGYVVAQQPPPGAVVEEGGIALGFGLPVP